MLDECNSFGTVQIGSGRAYQIMQDKYSSTAAGQIQNKMGTLKKSQHSDISLKDNRKGDCCLKTILKCHGIPCKRLPRNLELDPEGDKSILQD